MLSKLKGLLRREKEEFDLPSPAVADAAKALEAEPPVGAPQGASQAQPDAAASGAAAEEVSLTGPIAVKRTDSAELDMNGDDPTPEGYNWRLIGLLSLPVLAVVLGFMYWVAVAGKGGPMMRARAEQGISAEERQKLSETTADKVAADANSGSKALMEQLKRSAQDATDNGSGLLTATRERLTGNGEHAEPGAEGAADSTGATGGSAAQSGGKGSMRQPALDPNAPNTVAGTGASTVTGARGSSAERPVASKVYLTGSLDFDDPEVRERAKQQALQARMGTRTTSEMVMISPPPRGYRLVEDRAGQLAPTGGGVSGTASASR